MQAVKSEALGLNPSGNLLVQIKSSHSASARLLVYTQGWLPKLEWSLAMDFPSLRSAMGAPRFGEMVRALVERVGSRGSLEEWSRRLPPFIQGWLSPSDPQYWVELVHLEAAVLKVAQAPNSPILHPRYFARLSEEQASTLQLRFAPSTYLLFAEAPVHLWVEAVREGFHFGDGERRTQEIFGVPPDPAGYHLVIHRNVHCVNWSVALERLTQAQHRALGLFAVGMQLGDWIDRCELEAHEAVACISHWLPGGILTLKPQS